MSGPAVWGDFVALPGNESALRAVRRVAAGFARADRKPPPAPLLVHGPSGTGKSLLVQTLTRKLAAAPTGPTVQVLPAREVRADSPDPDAPDAGFADLLACDVLALEDLQLLPVKSTDAACHLLDDRTARRRTTVMTATVGPAGLKHLPRRLTTRLAAGLVVRIDPPDGAGRRQLAERLVARRKLTVAPSGLDWLAATADGIRPLVGSVERLRTLSRGFAGELDAAAVRDLLADGTPPAESPVERIVARVAAAFGVTPKALLGKGRQPSVALARQVAMTVVRESTGWSFPQIGAAFGRDHTTVVHSFRKIQGAMGEDAKLRKTVCELVREAR